MGWGVRPPTPPAYAEASKLAWASRGLRVGLVRGLSAWA